MKPLLKHITKTLEHKWYVLIAGLKVGAPLWRLIIHDWSKFTPAEAPHYARQFYGKPEDFSYKFAKAWNHHIHCNPHHWEHWVCISGRDKGPLPMPVPLVLEMVADWMGASRAYSGKWPQSLYTWDWWQKNWSKIELHPSTRATVIQILNEQGIY